jgi:hypothetical protein
LAHTATQSLGEIFCFRGLVLGDEGGAAIALALGGAGVDRGQDGCGIVGGGRLSEGRRGGGEERGGNEAAAGEHGIPLKWARDR